MENTQTKGRWYKLAEAAQLLGVSEITVRRKAKSGLFKAILRNGKYMVFLEEDRELGLFTGTTEAAEKPSFQISNEKRTQSPSSGQTNQKQAQDQFKNDPLIQNLKRTIEDQQTLIASLEDSISRMHARLSNEKRSNI